ncbi:hypothetical protein CPB86DRAFT_247857 [Serendipita vermifera]|nr:hypothetical protein CPB86DRAFT_247857 [Serendipita vermifera]
MSSLQLLDTILQLTSLVIFAVLVGSVGFVGASGDRFADLEESPKPSAFHVLHFSLWKRHGQGFWLWFRGASDEFLKHFVTGNVPLLHHVKVHVEKSTPSFERLWFITRNQCIGVDIKDGNGEGRGDREEAQNESCREEHFR